jgi:predicted phosphodiesterase
VRFLVLSDVHGNRFGLEAAVEAASGRYDRVLCLGDVVGYGAHPNECCEIIRELHADCLLGNHDAAALGKISTDWFNEIAEFAVLWTRRQLSPENTNWLESLQPAGAWPEYSFQAVHGSVRSPLEEYIMTRREAQPSFAQMQQPLCFFGHTHVAMVYEELNQPGQKYSINETALRSGGRIELDAEKKYLVNPGSCGQPRDRNPQARYAVFDSDTNTIEVLACDYDIQAAREAIIAAGLPTLLGDRLLQGR